VKKAVDGIKDLQNSTDKDQKTINAALDAAEELYDLYADLAKVAQKDSENGGSIKAKTGYEQDYNDALAALAAAWDALDEDVQTALTNDLGEDGASSSLDTAAELFVEAADNGDSDENADADTDTTAVEVSYAAAITAAKAASDEAYENSDEAKLDTAKSDAKSAIEAAAEAANVVLMDDDDKAVTIVTTADVKAAYAEVDKAETADAAKAAGDAEVKKIDNKVITAVETALKAEAIAVTANDSDAGLTATDVTTALATLLGEDSGVTVTAKKVVTPGALGEYDVNVTIKYGTGDEKTTTITVTTNTAEEAEDEADNT
jgi:hypothetical protein